MDAHYSKQLTIQTLEQAIKNHSYIEYKFEDVDYTQTEEEINEEIKHYGGKIEGTIIDVQTANLLVTAYKELNEDHKAKFERMLESYLSFEKLVNFCWSIIK